jgi:chemotaxis protein MotB
MKNYGIKMVRILVALAAVAVLTGCTNWEKKYKAELVENENLRGTYENCMGKLKGASGAQSQLGLQLSQKQQLIDDLQRQIDDMPSSAGTGFEGDVAVDALKGTITVTLPNEILFASGKATLKKSTISELDQIKSVISQRYSGKQIEIVGHTDSDPIRKSKWTDNWQLSAERALTVLRYLNKKGIPDDQISAVAAGASRPIASNTGSGKAKNRRVEIVVNTR